MRGCIHSDVRGVCFGVWIVSHWGAVQAIMAKRRRGGGGQGETDHVDAQLRDRDAAEDLAFLRSRPFTLVMRPMGQMFRCKLLESRLQVEHTHVEHDTTIRRYDNLT